LVENRVFLKEGANIVRTGKNVVVRGSLKVLTPEADGFLKRSESMEIEFRQNVLVEKQNDMEIERINEEEYPSKYVLDDSCMQLEHDIFDKVDRSNTDNPQMVSHVAKHIFKYLRANEVRLFPQLFCQIDFFD